MEYTFTKEDIELVKKFIDIKNRGYYADGGQVTQVYNRVLHKNVNVTNCGSCIRGRIQELENVLNHFNSIQNKASEPSKNDEVENVTPDNNKASEEPKKRVGRPSKKS